jgi:hypothetical protein
LEKDDNMFIVLKEVPKNKNKNTLKNETEYEET